jgi:hypothetical protein
MATMLQAPNMYSYDQVSKKHSDQLCLIKSRKPSSWAYAVRVSSKKVSSGKAYRLFANGIKHDGTQKCQPSVANRPTDYTPGISLGTDLQRKYFCWIEPRNCEPCGAKYRREYEDKRCGCRSIRCSLIRICHATCILAQARESSSKKHGNALAQCTPVQSPPAPDAVESEDTDQRCEHVEDIVQATDPCALCGVISSDPKDSWRIHRDTCNTNPFLSGGGRR